MAKYILNLNEELAKTVALACEFFARIKMGQFNEIPYLLLSDELPENDYCTRRDTASKYLLDARNESQSAKRFTDTPMWNSTLSDRIGPMTKVDRNDPNCFWYSPVEAESFESLPPAYIETAEFDCLHDDGILYADLLQKAGIKVTLNETKGTMHGFDIATKAPTTLAALKKRIAFMKRMYGIPQSRTEENVLQ